MVCDAGAHRHRRKHPLSMPAVNKQRHFRTLLYSILSTEEKISRRMAYPGKNPLPGYVFLITQNLEKLVESLKKVIGMTKLIGTGDEIVPLSEAEISLITKLGGKSSSSESIVKISQGIIEGDQVHILSGPLKGLEGAIRKIDRHKRIAYLSVDMFNRTVDMKVGLEIVAKNKEKNNEN